MITKQARLPSPAVQKRLERGVTRQEDMPPCATCGKVVVGAAIKGWDGAWRDLSCHEAHNNDVLRESGESSPVESDNVKHFNARVDEAKEKQRKERAAKVCEKYGVSRRKWS